MPWYKQGMGDARIANLTMMLMLLALPVVFLVLSSRPGWGMRSAGQTALRAGLPFASAATQEHIGRAIRRRTRTGMRALLPAMAGYVLVLLFTPLGDASYASWVLVVIIVCGVTTLTAGVHTARDPLFRPPRGAVRVARAARLRTRDYLGTWRTLLPRVLLGVGVVAAGATAAGAASSPALHSRLPLLVGCLIVALAVTVSTAVLEQRVLNRAQPASDVVELAWDDLFRTHALSSLRAGAAIASWLPVGAVAVTLLSAGAASTDTNAWLVFFGIPFLQLIYVIGSGRLPAALRPALARRPA